MKDWQNISDHEFDDLFLKASKSQKEPPFSEQAWSDVSELLQKEGLVEKGGFWNSKRIYAILALLLLISFAGYKGYETINNHTNTANDLAQDRTVGSKTIDSQTENSDIKSELEKIDNPTNEEITGTQETENVNSSLAIPEPNSSIQKSIEATNKIIDKTEKRSSIEGNEKSITSISKMENLNSKEASKNSNSSFSRNNKVETSGNYNLISKDGKSISNISDSPNLAITTNNNQVNSFKETSSNTASSLSTEGVASTDLKKMFVNGKPLEITGKETTTIPTSNKTITPTAPESKTEVAKASNFRNKLYLSLGYSPDISVVLNNPVDGMGSNFAAQLHYKFNDRWSIQTGVIKSYKKYGAGATNMFWPASWGLMPKEMKGMNASCNLIDIPLNVRFDFKTVPKTRFYLMSGVSSYLQISENYKYVYPEGFDPALMKSGWEGNSKLLFAGTGNFAIGYERELFRNFSIQIEPFVKAPLRNFGVSQVKLLSTGVLISGKVRLR